MGGRFAGASRPLFFWIAIMMTSILRGGLSFLLCTSLLTPALAAAPAAMKQEAAAHVDASAKQVQSNDEVAAKVDANLNEIMPRAAILGEDGSGIVGFKAPTAATGKGDMLSVNREGKGNLPPLNMRMSQAVTPDATGGSTE